MSFPEELTYVTVTGRIAGAAEGSSVQAGFHAPSWLIGGADDLIVPSFTISAVVAEDGSFSVQLPATDDPAWTPQNWTYDVTLQAGSRRLTGTLAVPAATVGALDLADALNPDGATETGQSYLLLSTRGTAGGVAGLDADGDVTDAAGNKITGGGGGGGPSPANTVSAATSYGGSSTAGAATTYSRSDHNHGTPIAVNYSTLAGKPSTFPPSAHASSHADGGADEILLDGSQITSGTVAFARLPTGTSSSTVAIGDHTHAGGGGGVTPTFARARITSGDITPPADAAMAPLAGGPTLSIAATSGDNLEFDLNCLIDRSASAGSDTYDIAIVNGSTVIRFASTGTSSEPGSGEGDPSIYPNTRFQPATTHWSLAVQSGDIVGGNVTFALCHKGAGTGKVYASTVFPFRWSVGNFKQ